MDELLYMAAADASKTMVEYFKLDYHPEQQHELRAMFLPDPMLRARIVYNISIPAN